MVSIALDKLLLLGAIGLGGYVAAKHFNLLGGALTPSTPQKKVAKSPIMRKQTQPFFIIQPIFAVPKTAYNVNMNAPNFPMNEGGGIPLIGGGQSNVTPSITSSPPSTSLSESEQAIRAASNAVNALAESGASYETVLQAMQETETLAGTPSTPPSEPKEYGSFEL